MSSFKWESPSQTSLCPKVLSKGSFCCDISRRRQKKKTQDFDKKYQNPFSACDDIEVQVSIAILFQQEA